MSRANLTIDNTGYIAELISNLLRGKYFIYGHAYEHKRFLPSYRSNCFLDYELSSNSPVRATQGDGCAFLVIVSNIFTLEFKTTMVSDDEDNYQFYTPVIGVYKDSVIITHRGLDGLVHFSLIVQRDMEERNGGEQNEI